MASLRRHYAFVKNADVIVWHEGDLGPRDADALDGAANVRFCLLNKETGWSVPADVDVASLPPMKWSIGYRLMIRFYAVTIWCFDLCLFFWSAAGGSRRRRSRRRYCSCGDTAGTPWRHVADANIPWRRVAAPPRRRRG